MNATNRKLLYSIAVVASLYLLLSLLCSVTAIWNSETYAVRMFDIFALAGGTALEDCYFDLGALLGDGLRQTADDLLETIYWDPLTAVPAVPAVLWKVIFAMIGVLLVMAGLFSKYGLRAQGPADDPQEYLITHRPYAFLKILLMPWNVFRSAWHCHYVPVIIPILFLPFMIPYALMAEICVIIVFAVEEVAVRIWVRRAASRDRKEYDAKVGGAVCPHCRAQFYQPRVVCSVCKLEMNYPVPGPHGVRFHTCNNGHRLPSTNRDGIRGRLDMICPRCGKPIKTHEAKPLVFAFVGATGAGKTALMLAGAEDLCDAATRRGIITEESPGVSKQMQANRAQAGPTRPGEIDSEYLFIRSRDLSERELVFNDISGTEFEADENRDYFEEYYSYCRGLVFAIDLVDVAAVFNSKSLTKGSKTTPQTVFDSFFQIFTTINRTGPTAVSDVPLAIVLTKVGTPAAATVIGGRSPEDFLRAYGQGGFVDNAAASFRQVRYFAADALKDDDQAAAPLRWLLQTADPELEQRLFASVPQA